MMLMCEAEALVEGSSSAILDLDGSSPLGHVLWPCRSLKGCALPLPPASLLFKIFRVLSPL